MSLLERLPLSSAVAVASGAPNEVADADGCKLVLYGPAPAGAKLKWNGACVDGYLSGPGTADLGFITYKGDFKRGLLSTGEFSEPSGYKYVGEMVGNQPQGRGEAHLPDGVIVKGQFQDSLTVLGIAELVVPGEAAYTGEIRGMAVMHGKGRLVLADGTVFEGTFVQNSLHGQGKMTLPDGESYEGEYAHGKHHGRGTYLYNTGERYTGDFAYGQQQGKGRLEHPDGAFEEGDWKAGRLHGQCYIKYAVGSEYTGQCLSGLASGQGKLQNATDGSVYEGAFLADKFHGRGRYTRAGAVFEGEFVGGLRNGKGKEVFASGGQYEGTYARDYPEGNGVLRSKTPDGSEFLYEGAFKNGLPHGKGKLTIGPVRFDGEFKANVFTKGRVQTADGRVLELDIEQKSAFEIRPDGAKVPIDPDQPFYAEPPARTPPKSI